MIVNRVLFNIMTAFLLLIGYVMIGFLRKAVVYILKKCDKWLQTKKVGKNYIRKVRQVYKKTVFVFKLLKRIYLYYVVLQICFLFVGTVNGQSLWEKKTFVDNKLAQPKDIGILFIEDKDENWELVEIFQKLHLVKQYKDKNITYDMLKFFEHISPDYYSGGVKKYTERSDIVGPFYELSEWKAVGDTQEYHKYFSKYINSGKPVYLYHSGNAMRNVIVNDLQNGNTVDGKLFYWRGAVSITLGEEYLRYAEKTIDNQNREFTPEEIGLNNLKTYLDLADFSDGLSEFQGYKTSFLCAAYCIARQCTEHMEETSRLCAKLYYYEAIIGERMLHYIALEEKSLYDDIAQRAADSYKKAQGLITEKPDFYDKEEVMPSNIRDGIQTIESLLSNQ